MGLPLATLVRLLAVAGRLGSLPQGLLPLGGGQTLGELHFMSLGGPGSLGGGGRTP